MICYACRIRPAVHMHHFIRRNDLSKAEKVDPRYQIPLCNVCHTEFHDSKTGSGIHFYRKHDLIDDLTLHCDGDIRWLRWLSKQESK